MVPHGRVWWARDRKMPAETILHQRRHLPEEAALRIEALESRLN